MARPTRTIGPLHLEDLEPHRFEDLVRQLLYDFKPWRQLEATGRAGSDKGFDARGWEIVVGEPVADLEANEEEPLEPTTKDDRLWLVQCKREKFIGPKKIITYMEEISKTERSEIYGVVFAAACNFSVAARDAFREKSREFGFAEGHLWGKGEIEDMLFQPKNDHLLFAYFGISLQARQRSLRTELRAKLAMKRKAKRCLNSHHEVLIRDASDDRYPYLDEDASRTRVERGRWRVHKDAECLGDGVRILVERHFAFLDSDGVHWDFAESMNSARPAPHYDPWRGEIEPSEDEDRAVAMEIWNSLPEENRGWFEVHVLLPYENILDIDEEGDEYSDAPHIYTFPWVPNRGPFADRQWVTLNTIGARERRIHPNPENRVQKFPRKDDGQTEW